MKYVLIIIAFTAQSISAFANVSLPLIFSDNMVLQRDKPIKIWGAAGKGEQVTIRFNGRVAKTIADNQGNWRVMLSPMKYGGPFDLKVAAVSGEVILKNILIGDIWVCSGQSNMEFTTNRARDAAQEIAAANYPHIRLFTVPQARSYFPAGNPAGGRWLECSPVSVAGFSAVGYFFGRKLNRDLRIPIGLINSSWGGTNIQAWISWDVMGKKKEYSAINLRDYSRRAEPAEKEFLAAMVHGDRGVSEKWFSGDNTFAGWLTMRNPQFWEVSRIGNNDGIIWFAKEFTLTDEGKSKDVFLSLGPIDDADSSFINGVAIGHTDDVSKNRMYPIATALLKKGRNTIVVKVTDRGGVGGFFGRPDQLYLSIGGRKIPLAGEWRYRPSVLATDFGFRGNGPNGLPAQLYNAMIAPLVNIPIKGVIWYQGEANTYQGLAYRSLLKELITDWRSKWGYDFPFLWVQLPNYGMPDSLPSSSDWAELREAQSRNLSLPHTAQAVTIDIGEAGNIHPVNKQDVGYRLGVAAEKITYGMDIVYSGPVYRAMKIKGNSVILNFSNIGRGLRNGGDNRGDIDNTDLTDVKDQRKGGKRETLKEFVIAGPDHRFVRASAYIDPARPGTVVVYNKNISHPVAVRYAWADNPENADLYNSNHLPASPFRTDNWNK